MYLGKALYVCISGFDKQSVIDGADKYCKENGYQIWNNVYKEFRLFKWKHEYKIDLYKPIDFKVVRESKTERVFPSDAHSFEVFAIKDSEESPTGKQAFIGYKLANNDFHFVGVPFTEPKIKT